MQSQLIGDIVDDFLAGDRLALSRLLTLVENNTASGRAALNSLFPYTGRAHIVGVTGSPGTGKSSLVNQLAKALRVADVEKVAIIAVDPSSPFTGGALLGDRVRMRDLSGDPNVFIRSMASRGALGGLARSTEAVTQVLDAAGYNVILIETVGAGQSEVDIARLAHTTLVVEAPGLGDDIQAIKAGILEIADILVVNKCDLPGAERTARQLKAMLEMAHPTRPGLVTEDAMWMPPVLMTCSTGCQDLSCVVQTIQEHGEFLRRSGEWQRRDQDRLANHLQVLLRDALMERWQQSAVPGEYKAVVARLTARELSPLEAVEKLLK